MRKLLQLAIGNPAATVLLALAAVWGGTFALLHLPVELFPGLDVPVVNVISHYPGAAAEDMELLVTRPLEDRLRTVPGLRRVASTSVAGLSQITVEFAWGTRLADARQLVQAQLSNARGELPASVQPRLESIGTTLQEVTGYVVSGGSDPIALRTAVRTRLASRLMGVDGVAHVAVLGGDKPAFVVRLRSERLARDRLRIGDVTAALARHNRSTPADFAERGGREYPIRCDSRLQTTDDLRNVPVRADGTQSILLADIAEIGPGRVPKHYQIHGNGGAAVAFIVSKQPNASTIDVVRGVDKALAESRSLLPPGAQLRAFYNQAEIVTEARDSLLHDLIVGAILAAAVLLVFMGTLRAALIVAATIPICLLATLAAMRATGQTLNVVTLSALTLAVGIVIDDAIVVAESVVRHLHAGKERLAATLAGTLEIAGPDISGTLTTVAVFAPLLLMGGIAGLFVRPFGLVVSAALLASLIVSLTFVPTMFGHLSTAGTRRALGAGFLAWLDKILQGVLRFTFAHRALTILFGVLLLGLGGLAVRLGPVSVLPPIDEGALLIEYVLPPGTSLDESGRIGDILDQEALAEPDVETVYRRTGSPEQGYQVEGVNRGELTIKLKPRSVRTHTLAWTMAKLRRSYEKIPGVAYLFHQPTQEKMDESLSGLPAVFGVTITGTDTTRLVALAGQAEKIMAGDLALANIINNTKIDSPQILVHPDSRQLARCGLTPEDVSQSVRAARFGVLATTVVHRQQQIEVLVKANPINASDFEQLRDLPILTPTGETIPLRQVAKVEVTHLPAAVTRLNGQREVTILAEVNGSIASTVKRLRRRFAGISLPDGYSITFTGQYQVLRRTVLDFALVGAGAIMLIFLTMAIGFHSWRQPLIVLITVPAALLGAIVLLAVTRVGLDVSVGIGLLTLAGIAVNNAIVLLDYANRSVAAGSTMPEALRAAVSVRLRPILMTAATTIFALLPVAVNPAVGSRMFQPFAVSVIGGLLSATAATLILVPTLAMCWHRRA